MGEKEMNEFIEACREYLLTIDIGRLRTYGREKGVPSPTKKLEKELIEAILGILSGKIQPVAPTNRGKPVKNKNVDPKIPETIDMLRFMYLGIPTQKTETPAKDVAPVQTVQIVQDAQTAQATTTTQTTQTAPAPAATEMPFMPQDNYQSLFDFRDRLAKFQAEHPNKPMIQLKSPKFEEFEKNHPAVEGIYRGQVEQLGDAMCALPLNCVDNGMRIVLPKDCIERYGLRVGDVISCELVQNGVSFMPSKIHTINETLAEMYNRKPFESSEACYPHERIHFYSEGRSDSVTAKYLDWILTAARGQRGVIRSAPKAGKTQILYEIANGAPKANMDLAIIVLLIGQAPEEISRFRKIVNKESFIFTTYDDEPENHVFKAEFALKRAKRMAESGHDVLLLVDSISMLAKAFNDTAESLGGKTLAGGLESKTLQYVKKYFGTARCLEKSGSLTIIGTTTCDSGNPADDIIDREISALANLDIVLSDDLAMKRVFPAIDFIKCRVTQSDALRDMDQLQSHIKTQYLPKYGAEKLLQTIKECKTLKELIVRVIEECKE